MQKIRAFTVVEFLVVIAIISLAAVASYAMFFESNKTQALDKDVSIVTSLIERARNLTLASKGNAQYGVRIETDHLVMFRGASYSAGDPQNLEEFLNTYVEVGAYSLAGGGQEFVFDKLTGKTAQYGTITLSLVSDPSVSKTITIHATGLIESE